MTYKASWDLVAKIVTIGVAVLFTAVALLPAFFEEGDGEISNYVIGPVFFLAYVVCYGLSPVRYSITADKLVIHRPWKDVVIDRGDIVEVQLLEDGTLRWSIRVFGSGGLFGYYGRFYNSKLGRMTWYATRRNKAVLVQTAHQKKLILTPDDAADFVSKLQVDHPVFP